MPELVETPEITAERALVIRCNRLLGSALVDANLISNDALEIAYEKMRQMVESGNFESASILTALIFEQKALEENELIEYTLKNHDVGLIDLRHYTFDELPKGCDLRKCYMTWTIPFAQRDGCFFMSTGYYLSPAIVSYWENLLNAPILWHISSMRSIMIALKKLSNIENRSPQEAGLENKIEPTEETQTLTAKPSQN
ncbi:MAG: hypothetical protein Tsb0018_01960 [Opitutales bacterium]